MSRKNKGITTKAWLDANGFDSSHIEVGPVRGKLVEEGLTISQLAERLQDSDPDHSMETYRDVVGRGSLTTLGLPDPLAANSNSNRGKVDPRSGIRRYAGIPHKGRLVSENKRLICFSEGDGQFVIGLACHKNNKLDRSEKMDVDDYLLPGGTPTIFVDEGGVKHTLFVERTMGITAHGATYGAMGELTRTQEKKL